MDYQRESTKKNPIPYQVDQYKEKLTKKSKSGMQCKMI